MLPTTVTTILKDGVSKIAMQSNTPVFFISNDELGNMCKIEVGASCAVVLE